MPRRKRLSPDAEQVAVYLTPVEQLVLQTIRARRKSREVDRTSPSEVIADALWNYLEEYEGVSRVQIQALLARPPHKALSKIKAFPEKGRR